MSHIRLPLLVAAAALAAALAGCGRTVPTLDDGGPGADGFWPADRGPGKDTLPGDLKPPDDGPQPCTPSCENICDLQVQCGLVASSLRDQCVADCKANTSAPPVLCLGQLVCNPPPPDCSAAKSCLVNPTVPDLQVTSFKAEAMTGGIRYTARVCNRGTGPSGAYRLHFYRNRSMAPSTGDTGERQVAMVALKPNDCRDAQAMDTGLGTGTYLTWAQVDAENTVVESNETNNVHGPIKVAVTTAPKLPDLRVTSMSAGLTSNGSTNYIVTVCNQGSGASSPTSVDLYYDRASTPPLSAVGQTELKLQGLLSGACTKLSDYAMLKTGTYTSWAAVDRRQMVTESDETNNVYGPLKVVVGNPGNLPDLVVGSLVAMSSPTGVVTYTLAVCNKGQATPPGTFTAYIYVHQAPASKPDKVFSGLSVPPGQCKHMTWSTQLKPGTYASWAGVDVPNQVKESNENNNAYGPIKVHVAGPPTYPDLVVDNLSIIGSSGVPGTASYVVKVCNKGSATAPSTELEVYTNRATKPGAATKGDLITKTTPLGAGVCTTTTLPATNLKPGTYTSWAYVDRSNYVKESAENNNIIGPVKVTVQGPPQPDLVVTGVNTTAYGSMYTRYEITVCNKGNAAVSYAYLDVYYDLASKPGPAVQGNYATYVYALPAGACTTRYATVVLSPGTYSSWVVVDRSDTVAESNESNNVYGPVKVTVAGSGQPDLTVVHVSATTNSSNGQTYYYVTVCNQGTATAGAADLDVYYNRGSAPPASVPGNLATTLSSLASGACTTRTLYGTLPGGTYKSWVRVDRTNVVKESKENNNVYGPVTVKAPGGAAKPDLQITGVTLSPSPVGSYTTYVVTVCNKGQGASGYTRVDLYYNTKPTAATTPDRYTTVYNLQPGDCTNRNVYATLGPGTYQSWLWVDRTNAVIETNETNNLYGPVKVTIP